MRKVSIIIPVYGVEKYIEKCLVSILYQTYENIEVIVVNDGTKDNSMEIVEKYIEDERLKIVNKENRGQSSARNAGLKEATGEYVLYVDGDDWVEENWVENILKEIKDEDVGIFSFTIYDDSKKEKIGNIKYDLEYRAKNKGYLYFEDYNFAVWNKVYKREYIKNFLFEEGIIYEDVLWCVYTLFSTENLKYIDNTGYIYRSNRMGSTMNSSHKELDLYSYNKISEKINEYLMENNERLSEVSKLILMIYKEYYYSIARKNVKLNLEEIDKMYKEQIIKLDKIEKKKVVRVLKSLLRVNKIDVAKGISLFDKIYWDTGIYKDKKIFRRMLKREVKSLLLRGKK